MHWNIFQLDMRNQNPEEITLLHGIKKRVKMNSNIEADQTFTSIFYDKMLIQAFTEETVRIHSFFLLTLSFPRSL